MFLFYGIKIMMMGEGGMFVINDCVLYDCVMMLNNYGCVLGGKQFWFDFIGFKYWIFNVQVVIGCVQFECIDVLVVCKCEIFVEYYVYFGGVVGLVFNFEVFGMFNSYWMFIVVFDEVLGIMCDGLLVVFLCCGIDVCVFFYLLSQMELFGMFEVIGCYNVFYSYVIVECVINLFLYYDMLSENIEMVCNVVFDFVKVYQEMLICLVF